MEIGQCANYTQFLDGQHVKSFVIQLVSENKKEWRFRFSVEKDHHLTVSKKCTFDHEWFAGKYETIKHRTLIEPF